MVYIIHNIVLYNTLSQKKKLIKLYPRYERLLKSSLIQSLSEATNWLFTVIEASYWSNMCPNLVNFRAQNFIWGMGIY